MKELCGDGTTTTMILLKACVEGSIKNIGAGGSPIAIKRGMEKALEVLLKELAQRAKPVRKYDDLLAIATASANGDSDIGRQIVDALERVGSFGVASIEAGTATETMLVMKSGIQFARGYVSSYFCTNLDDQSVELQDAAVLITDQKINSIQEILSLLQTVAETHQSLLIIADDIQGDALSTLVVNKLRGTLNVCVVRAPEFGVPRRELLQDIAVLTGSTLISEEIGLTLREATADVLGIVQKGIITKDHTILIHESSDRLGIQERIKLLDAQLEQEKKSDEREKLSKRKAQLCGGVAVIKVGGATESEMQQKKQAFEDSLSSTQAASQGGIVTGGGITLLQASLLPPDPSLQGDDLVGFQIVMEACKMPFKQLMLNAGLDPSLILDEVLVKGENFGFNSLTGHVEDLYIAGVMDAVKVVESSLKIAISSASIVLLSEVLIGNAD
jgi:chaperonin GroEL